MGNSLSIQNVNEFKAAAEAGNLKRVRRLLAAALSRMPAASCSQRDQICLTAAEAAANRGHLDVVSFLLQTIENPDSKNSWCCYQLKTNSTELFTHSAVVQSLIKAISDQNIKEQCCLAAIEQASRLQNWPLVAFLMQTIVEQSRREEGCSKAIEYAARFNEIKEVGYLVETISDPILRDRSCENAAKVAAKNGHFEAVKFLVTTIADENLRDSCCMEAADAAASEGHMRVCKFLVQTISGTMTDQCCLLAAKYAARFGDLEVLEFLTAVEKIADEDNRDKCCFMALIYAAMYGQLEAAIFLEGTISEHVKDEGCASAVEFASIYNHLGIVEYLVPRISDANIKDVCCKASAELSVKKGQYEVARFLISSISDKTKRYQCCETYMDHAISEGFSEDEVLNSLLEKFSLAKTCSAAELSEEQKELFLIVRRVTYQNLGDKYWRDAAELAAKRSQFDRAISHINEIKDRDMKDSCCCCVVKYAANCWKWDMVKNILEAVHKKSIKISCSMESLESAARSGNLDAVKFLMQNISNKNLSKQCFLESMQTAAINGHYEVIVFLVGNISDKELTNKCCSNAAEHAAAWGRLKSSKFLLEQISDAQIKHDCCIRAAETAGVYSHSEVEIQLLRAIDDEILRDQCCVKHFEIAAEDNLSNATRFIDLISDQNLRDRLCIKHADIALYRKEWKVAMEILHVVSELNKTYICTRIAESAALQLNCKSIADIAQSIKNDRLRDQFWMKVAQSVARKAKANELCEVLKTMDRDCQRVQSRCSTDVAAIPPHWLAQNSPLLDLLSNLAISGDTAILLCTLARMQPAQITQLLCLSITCDYVALARTIISDNHFSRAHVDQRDSSESTALMLASDKGHDELIEQLLNVRSSVLAQDSQGRTALSRACEAGHVRAVKALTDRGADTSHRDGREMTCEQLAHQHPQLRILLKMSRGSESNQVARDRHLSEDLHQLLCDAGFTLERAVLQQHLADLLDGVARVLTTCDSQMTGSFAEGWANSLVQVNGKTAADSDIDWTFMVEQIFHLEGGCNRSSGECKTAKLLKVIQGHALVDSGAGSQPAVTAPASGVRPAQDACHAIPCCSGYCDDQIRILLSVTNQNLPHVHLVRATRPNSTNELRVSFSFHEKQIMRNLNTVQGQLFTVIKFIFKRYLPITLATPGLKTYHAKTLLFFMLKKHGMDSTSDWESVNLISLLKESIDMMLDFIGSRGSSDECMPHFFMPNASLYFKNAGIGGDFGNTNARVHDRLRELRSDIGEIVEQMRKLVRPFQSRNFYFHLFCLMPLRQLREYVQITDDSALSAQSFNILSEAYNVVHLCVTELTSAGSNRDALMQRLASLQHLQCFKCAYLSLRIMAHWKFSELANAEEIAMELTEHLVKRSWKPSEIEKMKNPGKSYINWKGIPMDIDWAWRFCFLCDTPPRFPFLPEFTQTLFTARLAQPYSSHLYVNFRCLSWSLQAELLPNRAETLLDTWFKELQEDPDLEELYTLAHYTNCCEHLRFCLRQMEILRDERHITMEAQDVEKIQLVRKKLWRREGSCC